MTTLRTTRHLIDEMALALIDQVPDLGNDEECMIALIQAGFAPNDIFCLLDVARDIARDARTTEVDLWDRLNRDSIPTTKKRNRNP